MVKKDKKTSVIEINKRRDEEREKQIAEGVPPEEFDRIFGKRQFTRDEQGRAVRTETPAEAEARRKRQKSAGAEFQRQEQKLQQQGLSEVQARRQLGSQEGLGGGIGGVGGGVGGIGGQGLTPQEQEANIRLGAGEVSEGFLGRVAEAEANLPPSQLALKTLIEGRLPVQEGRLEAGSESLAEIGLFFPEVVANFLSDLTGIETKFTREELAETGFGKVVGLSSLAVTLGAGGILIGGAVSGVLGGITKVIGGTGAGVVGGIALTEVDMENVIDTILNRQKAEELQSAVTTVGQMQTDIVGVVREGGITKAQGIAEINRLERDLNILEGLIQQAIISDPRITTSGKIHDLMFDISDSQNQLRSGKAEILATVQGFDSVQVMITLGKLEREAQARGESIQPPQKQVKPKREVSKFLASQVRGQLPNSPIGLNI